NEVKTVRYRDSVPTAFLAFLCMYSMCSFHDKLSEKITPKILNDFTISIASPAMVIFGLEDR
ncbi:MAG: hypothetical protein O7D30_13020, partial [Rickettsia endosymbiont of Ixodes persulcatus]|nr:hypothetical protein [Rickettsia endosymbiont of Ixodes persulcatus]